jgi:hypothetical protein
VDDIESAQVEKMLEGELDDLQLNAEPMAKKAPRPQPGKQKGNQSKKKKTVHWEDIGDDGGNGDEDQDFVPTNDTEPEVDANTDGDGDGDGDGEEEIIENDVIAVMETGQTIPALDDVPEPEALQRPLTAARREEASE